MIPWTAAYQAPPSTGFSRQEYWSGVPLPSPEALSVKGLKKNPFQFPEGKHTVGSRNPVLLEPEKSQTFLIHPLCSKGTLFLDC